MPSRVCYGGILHIAMSLPAIHKSQWDLRLMGCVDEPVLTCRAHPFIFLFITSCFIKSTIFGGFELFIYQGKSLHCLP